MAETDNSEPNELLQYERERRGWSRKYVAEQIGAIEDRMVGRWEREGVMPSSRYRQALSTLFGKSPRELGFVKKGEVPYWNAPFRRNPFFTGREDMLEDLHESFRRPKTAGWPKIYSINGLAGIGKTQVAIEYAYRYAHEYHSVLWASAESREVLISDFAAIAALLHLEKEKEDQDSVPAVKRWLDTLTRWLLILEGLFRKCVIADNCALIANAAFGGSFGKPSLPVALLGMYAFAWQIYGDFSGYSSIARGCAQLMGFHFMVNFRQPYFAESIQDFWRRWHISLSTWLRDYLYIPLGGNRHGERKTYRNLMLTMLLGGLWHGANWTFVIWGGLHGGGLSAERKFRNEAAARAGVVWKWLRRIFIFHVVCLAWIFFRAQSLSAAWAMLKGFGTWSWRPEFPSAFFFLALFSLPLLLLDLYLESSGDEYLFASASVRPRVAFGLACALIIAFLGANQANAFIYFQF